MINIYRSPEEKLFRKAEAKKKMDVQMLKFKKPPPQSEQSHPRSSDVKEWTYFKAYISLSHSWSP